MPELQPTHPPRPASAAYAGQDWKYRLHYIAVDPEDRIEAGHTLQDVLCVPVKVASSADTARTRNLYLRFPNLPIRTL